MAGPDLRSFVSRSTALLQAEREPGFDSDLDSPTTVRETRTWLVDPFLETLGWDVHADVVATDATVEDVRLEYVLGAGGGRDDALVPALFVAVESFDTDLDESRARALLEAMPWTGVDRAIYTNGRQFLLLAGTTDADRLVCRLPELPEHASSIEHYSRAATVRRLDPESEPSIARRLALERESLVDAFVEQLTDAAGARYDDAFETAADRFLDRLVVSFAEDESERFITVSEAEDVSFQFTERASATDDDDDGATDADEPTNTTRLLDTTETTETAETTEPTESNATSSDGDRPADDEEVERIGPTEPESNSNQDEDDDREQPAETAGTTQSSTERHDDDDSDSDGEYVARFFNERGSIGAIGHSRSDRALVGVAAFLFERGLSGIRLPWSPDEGGTPTLLNDEPIRADGEPMIAPNELSNGLYIETAGDVETRAERASALASRAGLRVMLTGDWE